MSSAVRRRGRGGDWELASGAPRVLKSTPEEAVVSLEAMVLLMRFTANASCSDTPAPSQPATLLAMMLLVTWTEYHSPDSSGKRAMSVPLTAWKRNAAAAAAFRGVALNRLALITRPGPVPSLSPERNPLSVTLPHSWQSR